MITSRQLGEFYSTERAKFKEIVGEKTNLKPNEVGYLTQAIMFQYDAPGFIRLEDDQKSLNRNRFLGTINKMLPKIRFNRQSSCSRYDIEKENNNPYRFPHESTGEVPLEIRLDMVCRTRPSNPPRHVRMWKSLMTELYKISNAPLSPDIMRRIVTEELSPLLDEAYRRKHDWWILATERAKFEDGVEERPLLFIPGILPDIEDMTWLDVKFFSSKYARKVKN